MANAGELRNADLEERCADYRRKFIVQSDAINELRKYIKTLEETIFTLTGEYPEKQP